MIEVLKKYWGYNSFRPLQEEIISAVMDDKDVLAILPTGAGKSICFQVPAMMKDGVCIVVSPLISLMQDQVERLSQLGINAVALHSGLKPREIDILLDNCVYGDVKLLYISPERVKTTLFRERVAKMKVSILVVDEAHCISQWGYDFRPSYLEIADLKTELNGVPTIALTASATREVEDDIIDKLVLKDEQRFASTFVRSNISYSVFKPDSKDQKLLEIVTKVKGSGIVYANTRKRTKDITALLHTKGISADYYHAGLDQSVRKKRQADWMNGKTRVIVATNAFGMGIDKPDVRFVVHVDLPSSLEAYYQEAGRAGRDGKKSYAVLLYGQSDLDRLKIYMSLSYPTLDDIRKTYQSLANYYKLAVGSGHMNTFDFNIEDFTKVFDLDVVKTYHVLKVLQRCGALHLSDKFENPSKLHITLDNSQLYKFQVANPSQDKLIKAMLRIYGGELFTQYVRISEQKIADQLGTQMLEAEKALAHLHKLGVIHYQKRNEVPQITFLQPRYEIESLPIDAKYLSERKKAEEKRVNETIEYAENNKLCRMAFISLYFGEHINECGKCDICLEKKKGGNTGLTDTILSVLGKKPLSLEGLIEEILSYPSEDVIESVRELISKGEVIEDDGLLKPTK